MKAKAIYFTTDAFYKLYRDCREEVLLNVPASHNRIVEEQTHELMYRKIKRMPGKEAEIEPDDLVIYWRKENLGTKKWTHEIDVLDWGYVKKVNEECRHVLTCGMKRPYRIVAICKKDLIE